eukprot:CAMPEP_0184458018 /NCGR_PEP_ID=MMETSP0740-20130409/31879_1 /TAXON_ID=385413 /ORGANISM="Thalassiosira miniscula, Strain CCMP1093" /LENGTH=48 /DNA_ID= /DNA_START= /DNA_END= /DNA_ORIENTATION=
MALSRLLRAVWTFSSALCPYQCKAPDQAFISTGSIQRARAAEKATSQA